MNKIEGKLKKLSPELQEEVLDFIDFLLNKYKQSQGNSRPLGTAQGKIKISDDFNAPLDEKTLREWGML